MPNADFVGTATRAVHSGASVTAAYGGDQPRTAGDVLVAFVFSAINLATTDTISCSDGTWTSIDSVDNRAEPEGTGNAHVWIHAFAKIASGGDSAPSFTSGSGTNMAAVVYELSNIDTSAGVAASVDKIGTRHSGTSAITVNNSILDFTQTGLFDSNEFALVAAAQERTAANLTWADSGVGTTDISGYGSSSILQIATIHKRGPDPTSTEYGGNFSTDTSAYGAMLVITFLHAPDVSVSISASPVNGSTTIPSPRTNVNITASHVSGSTTIHTPAITHTSNASITASHVSGTTTIHTPTITHTSNASITAVAVSGSTTIHTPTITHTSNVSITASPVNGAATIASPDVATGGGTAIHPTVVSGTTTIAAPGVITGRLIVGSVVNGATTITAPAIHEGSVIVAGPVNGSTTIVAPGVHGSVSISADAVDGVTTIPDVFTQSDINATWQGTDFGLDATGATSIDSVTITVIHHESDVDLIDSVTGQIFVGSTPIGDPVDFDISLTDVSNSVVAMSGIDVADVPDIAIQVAIHATAEGVTEYIDSAFAVITFSAEHVETAVNGFGTIPAPTLDVAASVFIDASPVNGVATIAQPTVSTVNLTIATVVSGTASIPAPTIAAGCTILETAVHGVASIHVPRVVVPFMVRPHAALSGTITPITFGGTVLVIDPLLSGTVAKVVYDGTVINVVYSGSTTIIDPSLAGTVAVISYGGTVATVEYGGTEVGWTMQNSNITLAENNDETLDVVITKNGSVLDLTDYDIEVYFKTSASTADDDLSTIVLGTASPLSDVSITNAGAGAAEIAVPASDLINDSSLAFWRLDILDASSKRNTVFYGSVAITNL